MSYATTKWIRVSRSNPCPICKKPDWCCLSNDGKFCICSRVESEKEVGEGGWGHWLEHSDEYKPRDPQNDNNIDQEPSGPIKYDWSEEAKKMFFHTKAPKARKRLSHELNVTEKSLENLRCGFGTDLDENGIYMGWYYSFPSRDPFGVVIGILKRYANSKKYVLKGSSNSGLFYDPEWFKRPGPILVCEGASDTAALMDYGLCSIGRPSNRTGSGFIKKLAEKHAPNKKIIIIGENDRKEERCNDGNCGGCFLCWPGKSGAKKVAKELKCKYWLPPEGTKDIRDALEKGVQLISLLRNA